MQLKKLLYFTLLFVCLGNQIKAQGSWWIGDPNNTINKKIQDSWTYNKIPYGGYTYERKIYARNNGELENFVRTGYGATLGEPTYNVNNRNSWSISYVDGKKTSGRMMFNAGTSNSKWLAGGSWFAYRATYDRVSNVSRALITAYINGYTNSDNVTGSPLYYPALKYYPSDAGRRIPKNPKLKLTVSDKVTFTNNNTRGNRLIDVYYNNDRDRHTINGKTNTNFLNITMWYDASFGTTNMSVGPFGNRFKDKKNNYLQIRIGNTWYYLVGLADWNSCDYAINLVPVTWYNKYNVNPNPIANFKQQVSLSFEVSKLFYAVLNELKTATSVKNQNDKNYFNEVTNKKINIAGGNPICEHISYGYELREAGAESSKPAYFYIKSFSISNK